MRTVIYHTQAAKSRKNRDFWPDSSKNFRLTESLDALLNVPKPARAYSEGCAVTESYLSFVVRTDASVPAEIGAVTYAVGSILTLCGLFQRSINVLNDVLDIFDTD
jgi:hypothetical protein